MTDEVRSNGTPIAENLQINDEGSINNAVEIGGVSNETMLKDNTQVTTV